MADERNTRPLLDTCRQLQNIWNEGTSVMYGGSLVYSLTTPDGWRSYVRFR
jgi:hypothetical protein